MAPLGAFVPFVRCVCFGARLFGWRSPTPNSLIYNTANNHRHDQLTGMDKWRLSPENHLYDVQAVRL
jgi:hypothetical protein